MSERKYRLIHYDLVYELKKIDRKAIIITDGYWDIAVEGNTYPIKEHLKVLGFTWSRKNRRWYKFCDPTKYMEESKKLAEQLSQLTDAPIYIVATPLDPWGEHIIENKYELRKIVKGNAVHKREKLTSSPP